MNDIFVNRHVGVNESEIKAMVQKIGVSSLEQLIDETIPANIRLTEPLELPEAMTEREYAEHIAEVASKNEIFTSYIGQGWYDTVAPAVILRNVFENPCWYTSYTPYQAEISQGRLEALLNFQTVIADLTGLPLANCSLLDEATAAAEAANMLFQSRSREQVQANANVLFVDEKVFASTLGVLNTRTQPQGIKLVVGDYKTFQGIAGQARNDDSSQARNDGSGQALKGETQQVFAAIVQYPNADGSVEDYRDFVAKANAQGIKVAVAADLLSLCLLTPPGEWGADVVFGSAQRFGIPMYYGGPSAGYFATKEEYKRSIPGRIIGVSKDAYGKNALRLALQTREQHIKREKATSNICTAQALLATMSGFYAVYHGPDGLKSIAERVHHYAELLSEELTDLGYEQENKLFFDTLKIKLAPGATLKKLQETAIDCKVNFHYFESGEIGLSIDETTEASDLSVLIYVFSEALPRKDMMPNVNIFLNLTRPFKPLPDTFARKTPYLTHEVFHKYRTETEMMRYIKKLEVRDISLAHSMISLGSCTMKLNAAAEMLPLNDPHFANIHPYAPANQVEGYKELIENLAYYLGIITGLPGVSFQPNSGAAGEYSGLMTIREYLNSKGQGHRNIVLIPASAHGTNPASAIQAGFQTVTIKCDENGNTDINDLKAQAEANKDHLAAFMITYPSTHGIFETNIVEMCEIIHKNGGQVYMDGANMNAQVGLTNPGSIGADVCHLNLHKTFAIPHGGGGPGVGPICCAPHLKPFLPSHPEKDGSNLNTVAAAPFGSAGILPITYGYIRMMGAAGLATATKIAILNANYLVSQLESAYGVVYKGVKSRVGHELILDCRNLKAYSGIDETDVAKRLIDYGFHAPTLSFPVHGTLMIEPTESESLAELDRFITAMKGIRAEIEDVAKGKADKENNVLHNAPHPQYEVCGDEWNHPYSREKAAFPADWLKDNKFWVNVARVDNAFGDRNLVTCC
ncbi:glycine dehydrogenase (decarboxylating) [Bacteroidia bacterium]|nr:glycine dehydrogenase (decarboxylating) [Bacteroidia bacterium]